MNGTQAQDAMNDSEHGEELEMLGRVLAPLGDEASAEILRLTSKYLKEVSPITWLVAQSEARDAADKMPRLVWELGSASPLDELSTVFAIFYDGVTATVYTFKAVQPPDGGAAIMMYTREYVHNVRFATGLIDPRALFADLEDQLTIEKE